MENNIPPKIEKMLNSIDEARRMSESFLEKNLDTELVNELNRGDIPFQSLMLIQICNRLEELIEIMKVRTYGK